VALTAFHITVNPLRNVYFKILSEIISNAKRKDRENKWYKSYQERKKRRQSFSNDTDEPTVEFQ